MKTSLKARKILFSLAVTAGLAVIISSCKKDNASTTENTTVTEADAAELTTNAIVPSSGGFAVQVNSSVTVYKTVKLSCGIAKDSSITKSSATGVSPSYNYTLSWNYLLNCSGVVPNDLTFNFTGSSKYDGPRMSSEDSCSGGFVLTGLAPTAPAYVLNTTYTRDGSQVSKIGRNYSFSSKLIIKSSDITVDKTSLKILSGTATVTISGASSSGKSFNFNGTITFNGNNKATLLLNSGASYNIQW
ncbi:hypothetical protein ACRQ5D_08510 [Mucilaginibacter sp. P25]|uniref:Lipoprotein n=1 Tax=Mucilaginibacter gossypii TaxID=551996 RepID=A0A1G8KDS1_9SPHI|nr:hypothetical protein [Mucilaginibacter gossypii]SDI41587.1 hypothetical protein SAMN05192573_12080 [Mucilaginibacter gossypii]